MNYAAYGDLFWQLLDGHPALRRWLDARGREVPVDELGEHDLLLVHNGSETHYPGVTEQVTQCRKQRINVLFREQGWFPQANHVYFDPLGHNTRSALVRSCHVHGTVSSDFEEFRNKYRKQMDWDWYPQPGLTVLIGQVTNDTALTEHSGRKRLESITPKQYLCGVADALGISQAVHLAHPQSRAEIDYFGIYSTRGETWDYLRRVDYVIGINSTVLLELMMLGFPRSRMLVLGRGGFHSAALDVGDLFLDRMRRAQVDVNCDELDPILLPMLDHT